jgi:hypothetical protein
MHCPAYSYSTGDSGVEKKKGPAQGPFDSKGSVFSAEAL